MRLLLDIHPFLWWMADRDLASDARAAIADPTNDVFVSAATAWEISIKRALGKLRAPDDLTAQLETNAFKPLPISVDHAIAAGSLPRHHDDPFDRMLIAQALLEQLTVVTRDPRFAPYDVRLLAA